MLMKKIQKIHFVVFGILMFVAGCGKKDTPNPEPPLKAGIPISVPADFKDGLVLKVLNGKQMIAQICNEYIPIVDKNNRVTVVYPFDKNGKPDLAKGFLTKDGGCIIWDVEKNTCKYEKGTSAEAFTRVFLSEGNIVGRASGDEETTVVADKVKDADNNKYKIVKIGTQYWMMSNLMTRKYSNGTPIFNGQDNWSKIPDNKGAYISVCKPNTNEPIDSRLIPFYGYCYNYAALFGGNFTSGEPEHKLAPAGWHVAFKADWQKLTDYLKTEPDFNKVKGQNKELPQDLIAEYGWLKESANVSGFSVYPSGFWWKEGLGSYNVSMSPSWWIGDISEDENNTMVVEYTTPDDIEFNFRSNVSKRNGNTIRCIKD